MRVLITGGAGFIGSNLVHHLSAVGGYEIVVLDNLCVGQPAPQFPDGVQFICGDFAERATIMECLHGVDVVVHLAALSGVIDSIKDPVPSFKTNVVGSLQLLELARSKNIRQVVNASTGGALLGDVVPPISEEMAPFPLSPYGASKLAVEGYCSAYSAAYGMSCATLRFSNIYGPRSAHKASVVANFIKSIIREQPLVIYGDGTQQRDYLYVEDVVRAIEVALRQPIKGAYQLGRGEPTTLKTLVALLQKVAGHNFDVRFEASRRGEVHSTWCNTAKAARELGFHASTDLEAGLKATWAWYLENQEIWSRQSILSSAD